MAKPPRYCSRRDSSLTDMSAVRVLGILLASGFVPSYGAFPPWTWPRLVRGLFTPDDLAFSFSLWDFGTCHSPSTMRNEPEPEVYRKLRALVTPAAHNGQKCT
jgi:hypothetical protein